MLVARQLKRRIAAGDGVTRAIGDDDVSLSGLKPTIATRSCQRLDRRFLQSFRHVLNRFNNYDLRRSFTPTFSALDTDLSHKDD
jgi:hypothetical protein